MSDMFEALAAPFPRETIHWRAQTVTTKGRNGPAALALAYIDARHVMARLDDVAGPANWQTAYSHADRKTVCSIGIRHPAICGPEDGGWIWKANGAGDTDIEAEKGALSDAFKRAAVMWGIGRYLYDLPAVWVSCELDQRGKWKRWTADPWASVDRKTGAPPPSAPAPNDEAHRASAKIITDALDEAQHIDQLAVLWREHQDKVWFLPPPLQEAVIAHKDVLKTKLTEKAA